MNFEEIKEQLNSINQNNEQFEKINKIIDLIVEDAYSEMLKKFTLATNDLKMDTVMVMASLGLMGVKIAHSSIVATSSLIKEVTDLDSAEKYLEAFRATINIVITSTLEKLRKS